MGMNGNSKRTQHPLRFGFNEIHSTNEGPRMGIWHSGAHIAGTLGNSKL